MAWTTDLAEIRRRNFPAPATRSWAHCTVFAATMSVVHQVRWLRSSTLSLVKGIQSRWSLSRSCRKQRVQLTLWLHPAIMNVSAGRGRVDEQGYEKGTGG